MGIDERKDYIMPTLKKLINQMEQNDPYIIRINEFVQQDEQTKHLLRGLKNSISFESSHNEYKLVARSSIANPYDLNSQIYHLTITKQGQEFLKGSILPDNKIQKFKVTFTYDFDNDLPQLNDDIVQLFEDAI